MEFIFGAIIILGISILLFLKTKKKRIPQALLQSAKKDFEKTQSLAPAHAILELHKIFVHYLQITRGKKEKAASTVQFFAKRFPNEKKVWMFHRLRNRIAHEPNVKINRSQADEARNEFWRALESLK